MAECIDNVTFAHSGLYSLNSLRKLSAMVCRSTVIPMLAAGSKMFGLNCIMIKLTTFQNPHIYDLAPRARSFAPEVL